MGINKSNKRRLQLKKVWTIALSLVLALFFCLPANAGAAPRVSFIDVSHYNARDGLSLAFYQTIKASGVNGVVVKVSDGTTYIDPAASVNVANAKAAGLAVSAYHFARFTSMSEAKQEAIFFDKQLRYVGFDKLKDGIVVVDVELRTASRSTLTAATNAFIAELQQLGYPTVDIYSGSNFFSNDLYPSQLSVKNPWLARYSTSEPVWPTGKGAWQWSSTFHFNGIPGNFDVSQDFSGKYASRYVAPNATPTRVVKKIGSVSLVNWLKKSKKPFSYSYRAGLAKAYGITNYSGTAAQNIALLSKLKSGVKPAPKPVVKAVAKAPAKKTLSPLYAVKSGDTLSGIGAVHHISYHTIMSLNGLHSWIIYPGQHLRLTGLSQPSVKSVAHFYTVRSGDSLWAISHSHKTTVANLVSLNHLHSDLIHPGEKLKY